MVSDNYLQFLCFSRFLSRVVTSAVYSRSPDGNRNWRYRVVDVDISVCGDVLLLEGLQDALEGAHSVLAGLCFATLTPPISHASTCNPLKHLHFLLPLCLSPLCHHLAHYSSITSEQVVPCCCGQHAPPASLGFSGWGKLQSHHNRNLTQELICASVMLHWIAGVRTGLESLSSKPFVQA